jgi:uncharacterized protein with PQ loop repeat
VSMLITLADWSAVLGWIYFLAWSLSFYAQPILNYKLKMCAGLSQEFLFFNITGFLFYGTFTLVYFIEQHMCVVRSYWIDLAAKWSREIAPTVNSRCLGFRLFPPHVKGNHVCRKH